LEKIVNCVRQTTGRRREHVSFYESPIIMKRHFLLITAAISTGVFAQAQTTTTDTDTSTPSPAGTAPTTMTQSTERTTTTTTESAPQPAADSIVMASGALVIMSEGRATRLDQDYVLGNGIRITPGGTITLKDGTSTTLRDGQMIDMSGNITKAPPAAITAANAALDAGTDGPGVSRRDALEGVANSGAHLALPMTSPTPMLDRPNLPAPSGEVMGGHEISTDRPLANPEASASPGSNRGLHRTGGGSH
jgi:hypothetical protein